MKKAIAIQIKTPKKVKAKTLQDKAVVEAPQRPTMTLTQDQLKNIEKLSMDQKCTVELEIQISEVGKRQWDGGKRYVTFEILGGKFEPYEDKEEPKNTVEARNSLAKKYA